MRPLLIALLWLLAACQPPVIAPTPIPIPPWGEPVTLAEAAQGDAPAVHIGSNTISAFWIGVDGAGVHHDARTLLGGELSPVTVLPLPPENPYDQRVYAASGDHLHLLWLDRGEGDVLTLFAALLAPDLRVERLTAVSDGLALRYAAVSDGAGGLWVAWSGGVLSEPVVSLRRIDSAGRPLDVRTMALDATFPALVRSNDGAVTLYWIQQGQVMAARAGGEPLEPRALTSTVSLRDGDLLEGLSAALDNNTAYLFWNISRADGRHETWFASGALGDGVWSAPVRLGIEVLGGERLVTPFGVGDVPAARMGAQALAWASPAAGQYDVLPVAVQHEGGLGIAYFRDGEPVGYGEVIHNTQLIGFPALHVDPAGHLYLAWTSPDADRAALRLATTRAG